MDWEASSSMLLRAAMMSDNLEQFREGSMDEDEEDD
jgi:hypothetical protein